MSSVTDVVVTHCSGDIRKDLREPVSPTMKAMHDRLTEANGEKDGRSKGERAMP